MNEAILTRDLVKRYGPGRALDGFTLAVPFGATLGLVGRNGAGKTTWMMTVAGLVRPDSGTINLLGRGPFDAAVHSGRVSILPQDSELPLEASVRELLVRFARLQRMSLAVARTAADQLLAEFNLTDKADCPVRALSHGMRKRAMVAQAFIGEPQVVLLDEPLSGLDPAEAERLRSFVRARRGRTTVVISSHQLDDIERLCTHVAFVEKGRVERMETLAALTTQIGRIVYALARKPEESLADGVDGAWDAERNELTVRFDACRSVEDVNAELLPRLIGFGVRSVNAGRSLEEAYLELSHGSAPRMASSTFDKIMA